MKISQWRRREGKNDKELKEGCGEREERSIYKGRENKNNKSEG